MTMLTMVPVPDDDDDDDGVDDDDVQRAQCVRR